MRRATIARDPADSWRFIANRVSLLMSRSSNRTVSRRPVAEPEYISSAFAQALPGRVLLFLPARATFPDPCRALRCLEVTIRQPLNSMARWPAASALLVSARPWP